MKRYRIPLVGLAIAAAIALLGVVSFQSATQAAYACSTNWQPAPTASPAAGSSPQPGYAQPDMGQGHVTVGTRVTYTYCPPASGRHYNAAGGGPIQPRLYAPTEQAIPEGWVHNLEHGAMVVLYRADSQAATPDGQASLRAFFGTFPPGPVCNTPPGTTIGPVIARFDDMAWPMAALVWGRVLPLQTLDQAAILDFYQAYGEKTNPEPQCAPPSDSPAPSSAPSASSAPSTSGAPSASAAPSATAGTSASSAPSTSAAPSAS